MGPSVRHSLFLSIPEGLSENFSNKNCFVYLKSKEICIWGNPQTTGPWGTQSCPPGLTSKIMELKKFQIKVLRYDSLIIKIPLVGRLSYFVVSGELQIKIGKAEHHQAFYIAKSFRGPTYIQFLREVKPSYKNSIIKPHIRVLNRP